MWLQSCLFGASQLPEPSIQSSQTSCLSHGSSRPHPPSRLSRIVKPHLPQRNILHSVQYRFADCAYHPARFIIFAKLAKLYIFFIVILVFPILLIFRSCMIAQNVNDNIQHLCKCCFSLSGFQWYLLNLSHMFLLLHNRCLCILHSLSCHCSLSIPIILDPFLCVFIAYKLCFLSFLCRKLLFRSYSAQCCQWAEPICVQATLAVSHLMMSSNGLLRRFAVFACQQWQMVLFRSIDNCILYLPHCWARSWMLQEMDHMKASCVINVKVGRFDQFEQSKISVLTVTSLRIVMPPVHYHLMVSVWFM